MVNPRIYRAAFVPVALALILLAFSLENRPHPLTTTLSPDAFDGARAFRDAYGAAGIQGLVDRYPDRRPGSPGDQQLATRIAGRLGAAGFSVHTDVRDGETIDGTRALRTVIAERTGTLDERVVVVAHRDAAGRRAAAELSGSAALLELARVFGAPRQTRRTLMLVSTSGGSGGAAGAAVLADELRNRPVAAVIVLGDLASTAVHPPLETPWSNALGGSPLRLRSTMQDAVGVGTGSGASQPRALSQFLHLALPTTYGEQGVLLERGIPAILLSVDGDLAPAADAPISETRLQAFGRVALRAITVLDGAGSPRALDGATTSRDVLTNRKVVPGWAIRLFTGALLLAPLLAAIDGFAAVRRKRERVLPWLRWTLVWALPFILAAAFSVVLGLVGLLRATPSAPVPPLAVAVQLPALLAVALVFTLAWVWLRPTVSRLLRAGGDLAEPGAGMMVMLVALGATVAVWIGNPYAAALIIPAMHAGLFAVASELRVRRAARLAAVVLGALPMALVAVALSRALGLDVPGAAWLALLLVAGGHVSLLSLLLWSLLAGCAVAALVVAARTDSVIDIPITVRGPTGYAGPGSLGGTESALRR